MTTLMQKHFKYVTSKWRENKQTIKKEDGGEHAHRGTENQPITLLSLVHLSSHSSSSNLKLNKLSSNHFIHTHFSPRFSDVLQPLSREATRSASVFTVTHTLTHTGLTSLHLYPVVIHVLRHDSFQLGSITPLICPQHVSRFFDGLYRNSREEKKTKQAPMMW